MLQNYITIAVRVLSISKIYTVINMGGLVTGITSFTLIMLYVSDEVSHDTANQTAEPAHNNPVDSLRNE